MHLISQRRVTQREPAENKIGSAFGGLDGGYAAADANEALRRLLRRGRLLRNAEAGSPSWHQERFILRLVGGIKEEIAIRLLNAAHRQQSVTLLT
ncbi:hypothetical protein [Paraburkholderia sp. BL21I4N1]|uniref:hypothetical protein n=1 Tax=Paraburkholderia sp. BL21I4N1 TaxID=1938801 RepID=UPI000CFDD317|nr:hypothetical protein [Paraburkholderia sp. BL21I4N1]